MKNAEEAEHRRNHDRTKVIVINAAALPKDLQLIGGRVRVRDLQHP